MASAISFALASCGFDGGVIPPIGKGLSQSAIEGNEAFDARVKERFPVGSSVAPMIAELQQQGFKENTYEREDFRTLDYRDGGFPVHTLWSIRWRESEGRITEIWGVFGHTGP